MVLVWFSDLLGVETLSKWPPKQPNVIRTEAQLMKGTQSWKNSKLKQVVPLGWVFLANLVWECTEVTYDCALSPGLSQNQELGTSPPCVSALLYITISHPHHFAKLWWSHALLTGNSCMYSDVWAVIPHSEHACMCDYAQTTSMGSEILTLGVQYDILPQVPWHILTLSLLG